MKRLFSSKLLIIVGALVAVIGVSATVSAVCDPSLQSCSSHFGVSESQFGSGGSLSTCSTNYCSKQSVGELGVGNSASGTSSSHYKIQAGFNTDRTPSLEFSVTSGTTNLGYLSVGSTKTATGTFKVKSYLSGGYIIQTQSDPPIDNAPGHHLLNALSSPTSSSAGTEQFGINLVQNNSPTAFGANPQQIPDNTFSFGTVASGYDQPGQFKYVKGDTIAQSTRSSGETDYTISYIFNIANTTPDGEYTFNHVLVATATF